MKEFGPNAKEGPSQNSWKNSIRHNLSLHEQFRRIPNDERGQSAFWIIDNDPPNKMGQHSMSIKLLHEPAVDESLLGLMLTN